jgi:pimeloyl-ACP methyl ester carboxylesterase
VYGSAPAAVGSGGSAQASAEGYLTAFSAPSAASQQAGKQALGRMFARTGDRDETPGLATVVAQFEAARVWSMPDHSALERLQALEMPVFVANGDSDQMILTHNTYLLAGLIPQARVKVYPDSGHGFLFQHHAEFAADVIHFLS